MKMNLYWNIETIQVEVKFEILIRHLESSDERIILNVLTLMNIFYTNSNNEEKQAIAKILHSKPFISAIDSAINKELTSPNQRIREQFVKIQEIICEELRNLIERIPTVQEVDSIMSMNEWNPIILHSSDTLRRGNSLNTSDLIDENYDADLTTNIKFTNAQIFKDIVRKIPPGSLALCAILEFTSPENRPNFRLKEILAENILPFCVWPVVLASLANFLISVLKIMPTTEKVFFQLLLKLERPFYEIFNVTVELFNRTWREMTANVDDLDKVLSVVNNQLERAFSTNPSTLDELDKLFQQKFSYFNLKKIWEQERIEQEELELNSQAIISLRDYLRPNLEQLVLGRKKKFLKNGLVFAKFMAGSKPNNLSAKDAPPQQQYWFWHLDENERQFNFMDCKINKNQQNELDYSTQKKLFITDIAKIVYGGEYSEMLSKKPSAGKFFKKASALRSGLCIVLVPANAMEDGEQLHLMTNNEADLNAWIDGMNCLILPQQTVLQAPLFKKEVDTLLNLEVRIRLLDVDTSKIQTDLPIPDLPEDLSWIPEDALKSIKDID